MGSGVSLSLQSLHDQSNDDAEEFTFLVGAAERLAAEASDIGKMVYEVEQSWPNHPQA